MPKVSQDSADHWPRHTEVPGLNSTRRELGIYRWPEVPELPMCAEPVIIRVTISVVRQEARRQMRAVLSAVLASWSGLAVGELPLAETARGPVWRGMLGGETLGISLSYGGGEGWIGLVRGGRIGVDVMVVDRIAEAEGVAEAYLGGAVAAGIRAAADPVGAFALAWTRREACIKCLGRELGEWTAEDALAEAACWVWAVVDLPGRVGAVALDGQNGRDK